MAEATRFKDVQAEVKNVQVEVKALAEYMDQMEKSAKERMDGIDTNNNARFDRLESTLDVLTNTTQPRFDKLEMAIENLSRNLSSTNRHSEILGETSPIGAGSSWTGHSGSAKTIKLDFPKFSGVDPTTWIFRAEQYFEYYHTPDIQKIIIASVNFEGEVVPWFQMQQKARLITSWHSLARAIENEYGPSPYDQPRVWLFKLLQTGSTDEYYREFLTLANRTEGVSDEALLDCFTGGLKPEVRRYVVSQRPYNLMRATELAKLFDAKIGLPMDTTKPIASGPTRGGYSKPFTTATTSVSSASPPVKTTLPPLLPTPAIKPMTSIKQMSPAEMLIRREKGLCYTCDEKFSPTHRCPNKQYMLMECDDSEGQVPEMTPHALNGGNEEATSIHHLSLHAFQGQQGKATIRFEGSIHGSAVQVLLDGDSSDSFVHPRIVKHLQLPVESVGHVRVMISDGHSMKGEGVVRVLPVQIQGHTIEIPAYVLPIAGSDVVIGASWLATLGPHVADYTIGRSKIKFFNNGTFVTLQGMVQPSITRADFHHLQRLVHMDAVSEFFMLHLDIQGEHDLGLDDSIPGDMKSLLHNYQEVFTKPTGLPPQRALEHRIILQEGVGPVKVRPYRYPFSQKDEIERMVTELLQDGLIQPSTSPFSAPVILVKKKDGTWRFCVDYRALNAVTIKDSFPMPTVDELLDELGGSTCYSKLDLRSGYHQVLMHAADREKTAFRTHQSLYEWLVMPFGLTNAPATFQALMNSVFRPFLRKFVLIFFDDILVYSTGWEQHLQHVEEVLKLMAANHLFAKISKCSFGLNSVEYLGHVISSKGVDMDSTKISAIQQWPPPRTVTQLKGFLGLSGYYRRFIRHYAELACPLTKLLQRDSFHWTEEAQHAFDQLKLALTTAPTLALPDFTRPFILETDASGKGIGAVLLQDKHPIAYFSKQLSPRLQAQSAYVRELYAITQAVSKFRHYLVGHRFVIWTDQESLKHLGGQVIQTPEQEAFLPKLMGYDYTIEYKRGKSNIVADSLSRVDCMAMMQISSSLMNDILSDLRSDPTVQEMIKHHMQNPPSDSDYEFRDGLLYKKHRLVIPTTATHIIRKLLLEFHASPLGGHSSTLRTYHRMATVFYWPRMKSDIRDFIKQCLICQQAKGLQLHPAGLLSPLPIPDQVWDDIAMDFITALPLVRGHSVIFVVIDRLSKYAHFMPLKHSYNSQHVAKAFIHSVVKLHGFPKTIVSDRDKVFLSAFWCHLTTLHGTKLNMSSAYHPQSDGQSEALNKCLEMYLRCFVFDCPRHWLDYLPWAEFWYNTSYHTAIGMTPFKVLYGRDPPSILPAAFSSEVPTDVMAQLQLRDAILLQLKQNLGRAQIRMKKFTDRNRTESHFEVGDFVFVKLQPYRQNSVALRKHQKLAMRYFGPFPITHKVGSVAYRLQLPDTAKIHPVFHVSMLKPYERPITTPYVPLPLMTEPEGPIIQPAAVLNSRSILIGDTWVPQILVQWDGIDHTTWEPLHEFQQLYPAFDLGDKVQFVLGGIVMDQATNQDEVGYSGPNDEVGPRRSTRERKLTWKMRKEPKYLSQTPNSIHNVPPLRKPNAKENLTKGNSGDHTKNLASEKARKVKKNPPCLYQWQSGKKSDSKTGQKSMSSSVLNNHCNFLPRLPSGFGESMLQEERLKRINDNDHKCSQLKSCHNEATLTPLSKRVSESDLDIVRDDGDVKENSNTSPSKTPPIQISVSPEIQCGSSLVSATTPACYGAGYIVSGVTDKRKCRPRGILIVGEDNPHFNYGTADSFDDGNGNEIMSTATMSAPLCCPCQVKLRCIGFVHLITMRIKMPRRHLKMEQVKFRSKASSSISPSGLPEFQGFSDSLLSPSYLPIFFSPNSTSSCKAGGSGKGKTFQHNRIEENSPYSLNSLSSGNVIQTPQSDFSSDIHVGMPRVHGDYLKKSNSKLDLDSIGEAIPSASFMSVPLGDSINSSFQFDCSALPSDSIDVCKLPKFLDDQVPWLSSSTIDTASQSQMRISWREGLMSQLYEMDDFDCCKCLSDEEDLANDCNSNDLPIHYVPKVNDKVDFDKKLDSDVKITETDDKPLRIEGLGKEISPGLLSCSEAESISTDGTGLVASRDDSDWMLCYKNTLFED
ncbi:uncharacterized protein LOC114717745 [Neltuma alba]|uniref:uncharacterized protein LOC114717745 n=1 Tax=Neltuma alba TaxID=207710 RepID=UPI0010A2B83A|nr:uncharacterized protein LOC114717745 [Prosopis alba]